MKSIFYSLWINLIVRNEYFWVLFGVNFKKFRISFEKKADSHKTNICNSRAFPSLRRIENSIPNRLQIKIKTGSHLDINFLSILVDFGGHPGYPPSAPSPQNLSRHERASFRSYRDVSHNIRKPMIKFTTLYDQIHFRSDPGYV